MRTRTERLRALLADPGLVVLPGCHDAISARIMERAGFKLMRWAATQLDVSVRAMEEACGAMRAGRRPDRIVAWPHLNRVAGLDDYYGEEERYRTPGGAARSDS